MEQFFPYYISTDSTCDMDAEWLQENGVELMSLGYHIDGQDYWGYMPGSLSDKEFYDKMRAGSLPTTTQVNPGQVREILWKMLSQGKDVLHLAFSSALSGTYSTVKLAAEELAKEFPERKIVVIDTLCASMGEGLMVYHACKMRREGKSLEEAAEILQKNRLNYCHIVTADELKYLYRGGRLSKTAAVMGTMLGVKPIIHMDDAGRLVAIGKIRGRKQALAHLVDIMEQKAGDWENPIVFICHSDCLEEAQYVQTLVEKRFGIHEFMIHSIGPTIGSHTGPGTIAIFFMGKER